MASLWEIIWDWNNQWLISCFSFSLIVLLKFYIYRIIDASYWQKTECLYEISNANSKIKNIKSSLIESSTNLAISNTFYTKPYLVYFK